MSRQHQKQSIRLIAGGTVTSSTLSNLENNSSEMRWNIRQRVRRFANTFEEHYYQGK